MSSSFIWLAVILTLVSAFVAYLGDLLGRHVGKRKIKLFGLRPRDSAIVVTSVTGGLITLITIAVLLLGNASLQNMAKSADEVIRLQAEAKTKIAESQQVIETADRAMQLARDEQAGLEKQIKDLNDQMTETSAEMAALQTENSRLDLDLTAKAAQEKKLAGQLKDLSARRDRLTKVIDANSSYILEQETTLAKLRTEATTLASTVKQYRAGEVVIAEGTCIAQVMIDMPADRLEIRNQLRDAQDAVKLPAQIVPVWPTANELEVAIAEIESMSSAKQAAVVYESRENALVGSAMQVAIRVLPSAVIFEPNSPSSVIKLWLLEETLNESLAYTAITEISPQISERAILKGLVPLMGDRRLVQFDALSLTRLATDVATAQVPAYIAFQAIDDIGPFDLLQADKNFTWRILPTGEPALESE